jgi:hypothetical protein
MEKEVNIKLQTFFYIIIIKKKKYYYHEEKSNILKVDCNIKNDTHKN